MNRRLYLKSCFAMGVSSIAFGNLYPRNLIAGTLNNDTQENRQLRFSIALKNSSNMELHDQILWIYIPATSSKQHLKNLNATVDFDLETDILNQNIMKFEFPKIGPLSTKIINVTTQIGMIREGKTEPIEKSVWLQAEHLIESNNLQIKLLALQLKQDTDANTCHVIYQWVSDHISYAGYIADDLGALYALNQQKGDCTEYACLAAALARANGIPARVVGGYVCDEDFVVQAKNYHHWTEVYFDGQWQLLDAQKRNWINSTDDYISFNYYQTHQPTKIGIGKRYKVSEGLTIIY